MELTQSLLKELLDYDPSTGLFRWRQRDPASHNSRSVAWSRRRAGMVAGYMERGYTRITVCGTQYKAHRLAWLYVHGSFPSNQIDHINGSRSDNRIDNLRDVTQDENGKNQKMFVTNTSGMAGVFFDNTVKKWKAVIVANRKSRFLGLYASKKDAIEARRLAEVEYGFHPNHGRRLA